MRRLRPFLSVKASKSPLLFILLLNTPPESRRTGLLDVFDSFALTAAAHVGCGHRYAVVRTRKKIILSLFIAIPSFAIIKAEKY
jgi:hypothetical protein